MSGSRVHLKITFKERLVDYLTDKGIVLYYCFFEMLRQIIILVVRVPTLSS